SAEFGFAFILGKADVEFYRIGKFVHGISLGKFDFEDIGLVRGLAELNGKFSRLVGSKMQFQGAEHARTDQDQRARIPGIAGSLEVVFQNQVLIVAIEVLRLRFLQGKSGEGAGEKMLERLFALISAGVEEFVAA